MKIVLGLALLLVAMTSAKVTKPSTEVESGDFLCELCMSFLEHLVFELVGKDESEVQENLNKVRNHHRKSSQRTIL